MLLLNFATDCGVGVLGLVDGTDRMSRGDAAGLSGYGLNPVGMTTRTVTFLITGSCDRSTTRPHWSATTLEPTR